MTESGGPEQRWTLTDLARRTAGPARYVPHEEGGTSASSLPCPAISRGCNRVRVTAPGIVSLPGAAARATYGRRPRLHRRPSVEARSQAIGASPGPRLRHSRTRGPAVDGRLSVPGDNGGILFLAASGICRRPPVAAGRPRYGSLRAWLGATVPMLDPDRIAANDEIVPVRHPLGEDDESLPPPRRRMIAGQASPSCDSFARGFAARAAGAGAIASFLSGGALEIRARRVPGSSSFPPPLTERTIEGMAMMPPPAST